jgi:hypothetical protein
VNTKGCGRRAGLAHPGDEQFRQVQGISPAQLADLGSAGEPVRQDRGVGICIPYGRQRHAFGARLADLEVAGLEAEVPGPEEDRPAAPLPGGRPAPELGLEAAVGTAGQLPPLNGRAQLRCGAALRCWLTACTS